MKRSSRIRVAAPLILSLAAAELAARLLAPAGQAHPNTPADPAEHFTAAEIARGARYERPQRRLALMRAAVEAGMLAALVIHARRRTRTEPASPEDAAPAGASDAAVPAVAAPAAPGPTETWRAAAEGAVVGAGLALATTAVGLPFSAISRRRALRVGLATQGWRDWGQDLLRATALESVFAAGAAGGLVAIMRRSPERWWLPAAATSVGLGVALTALAPVLLDPIFNDFEALADGELRRDVLALARAAGVKVGEVFAVDASRRTSAANAYVTGLGPTKRVVLFDTLLDRYDRDEIRVVVAHELAHVRHRDVARGVALMALVAGPAARAVQELGAALAPGPGGRPEALPALALAAGLVSLPLGVPASRMSRALERRADAFSLALTGAPAAFVSFERKIAVQNVADVRQPRWFSRLMATHPPTMERIAAALAAGA